MRLLARICSRWMESRGFTWFPQYDSHGGGYWGKQ